MRSAMLHGDLRSTTSVQPGILRPGDLPPFPLLSVGSHSQAEARNEGAISADSDQAPQSGQSLYLAISNANVRLLREYTGRGPTKARTTIRDNIVVVMLEQTLTKGERVLVEKGRGENVLELRHEYQEAMRDEISAESRRSPAEP
jgi:Na+-translocating membrane potential-generating system (MpsC)